MRLPAPRGGMLAVPEAARGARVLRELLDPAPIAPAATLYVLRDVVVHAESGVVFHDGCPITETVPAWRRRNIAEFLGGQRFAAGWAAGVTAEVDEPLIAVWNAPARNYSHWHFDGLAALTMAREALGAGPRLLMPKRVASFQASSLGLLPWAGVEGALRARGLVRCRTLVWPSTLAVSTTPTGQAGRAFDAIRAAVAGCDALPAASRLYVARFDVPDRRAIDNEEEVAEALARRGFEIIVPGKLPYVEQVQRFAQARVVVGAHGAGLTNAGFAAEDAMLVELHPAGYGGPHYVRLAMLRGLTWRGWLMQEHGGTRQAARCRVDVPALLEQLEAWGAFA
jgi:capsular polysaccharide biosynthesis protein